MHTLTSIAPDPRLKKPSVDFDLLADVLPPEMLLARRWLLWVYVPNGSKKPKKVPHYASGARRGKTDTPKDLNSLATFKDIAAAVTADPKWAGVGFALGKDGQGYWQGIDLDHINSKPWLQIAADSMVGYTETSPSGDGLHAIGYGQDLTTIASNESGIEVYSTGRYFTVTGDKAGGELCDLANFVRDILTPIREKHDLRPTQEAQESQESQVTQESQESQASRGGSTATPTATIKPIPKDALTRLLPTSVGHRNKEVFELARYCMGKYPKADRNDLKPLVRQWHEAALPFIGTKEFSETWADFCISLPSVKFPKGAQLSEIMERIQAPAEVPPVHEDLGVIGYRLLLICTALQEIHGEEPFFLSYRTAGELIGRHFTDAGKLLKFMVMEGYLREVSKGNQSGRTASTYLLLRSA